jgi:hypothetical protein
MDCSSRELEFRVLRHRGVAWANSSRFFGVGSTGTRNRRMPSLLVALHRPIRRAAVNGLGWPTYGKAWPHVVAWLRAANDWRQAIQFRRPWSCPLAYPPKIPKDQGNFEKTGAEPTLRRRHYSGPKLDFGGTARGRRVNKSWTITSRRAPSLNSLSWAAYHRGPIHSLSRSGPLTTKNR